MKIGNLHVGYACINTRLAEQGIRSGKDIKKETFKKIGLEGVSEVVIQTLEYLKTIIQWNADNGVDFYRISSGLFPWMSEYEIEKLPRFNEIADSLKSCEISLRRPNND